MICPRCGYNSEQQRVDLPRANREFQPAQADVGGGMPQAPQFGGNLAAKYGIGQGRPDIASKYPVSPLGGMQPSTPGVSPQQQTPQQEYEAKLATGWKDPAAGTRSEGKGILWNRPKPGQSTMGFNIKPRPQIDSSPISSGISLQPTPPPQQPVSSSPASPFLGGTPQSQQPSTSDFGAMDEAGRDAYMKSIGKYVEKSKRSRSYGSGVLWGRKKRQQFGLRR